jgi:hypothetical protein
MRDRIIEKYKLDSRYNHQLIPKISKLWDKYYSE